MADKKPEEFFVGSGPKPTKWQSVKTFIWNSETSEFMGRTGVNWAKITIFYVIFYTLLAGFFAGMLMIFYQTLDFKIPKWQNKDSLIGTNPGLGFRPMPPEAQVDSTLIQFKHGIKGDWQYWVHSLTEFLEPYETLTSSGQEFTNCDFDKPPQEGKACNFNVELLGDHCTKENNFGYELGKPCVLIKLNKIFGWRPEVYNSSAEVPEDMPADLKSYIKDIETGNKTHMNMVWLSCEGETANDKEKIGTITYTPFRGFPAYYYPYLNVPGYLTPVVALQFGSLQNGQAVNVECKAWANNISRDRQRRLGSVHFEIRMD
ncbi:sodium/potassium-transporting ATPase subunit beta isoform X2 [Artemia franciscana]|uniref:Sodium/potassium-transporting ATPase subunit beta n=4 Tax=Artemia TaxID=6660 RepID=A0AA88H6E5_ARTSF|nr:hypothetical protein QYM36_015868 [Artemia franciscana]WPM94997.1 sodium/potassium-transporting ATPase subunit beta 2 [Artemia franciscana]